MHQLAPLPSLPAEAVDILEQAAERARHARAPNTVRAYKSDMADFEAFCAQSGFPFTINGPIACAYFDQLARRGAKVSTIRRRLAALNASLRAQNLPALSLREEPLASVVRGIRREIGDAREPARPMEIEAVRAALAATGDDLAGLRDRALLLLGFAGAFRRSELTGLDFGPDQSRRITDENPKGASGYVQAVPEGLRVTLYRSKTNQTGELEEVGICRGTFSATCPVSAFQAWQAAIAERVGVALGPVFRAIDRHGNVSGARLDGGSVARIVKRATWRTALAAGASPEEAQAAIEGMSGHSLRSGFVTTAFAKGLTAEDTMRQTRHRNVATLLRYRRHATVFVGNVSGRVGL